MSERLKGRNAVVTGAGVGIGAATALALAAEGAKVVVNDPGVARDGTGQDKEVADKVVDEIKARGGIAVANYDSVSEWSSAERIIKACVDNFERIDILVNNAGFLRDRMIFNMTEDEWSAVINVMLNGNFYCCRHASVFMRNQKYGRIINITSDAWRGTVGHVNYGAAKAGIVGLTRAIARELGRYGVTCNAVAPSAGTRMTLSEEVKEGIKKRFEAGLITKAQYESSMDYPPAEGVAPLIVHLASDAASNINGMVFHSEAGRVSIYSEPMEVRCLHKDYKKYGSFTVDELAELVPRALLIGYTNPAPPRET